MHIQRQVLLVDADDTLWENNVYFERAISSFISLLDHQIHAPGEVREVLNACEHETIQMHGYGVGSFEKSLLRCFAQLSHLPVTLEHERQIRSFARSIVEHEIELLDGVAETLPGLAERHTVILVTKGDPREQRHKLDRSGIHEFFSAVEIPPEKNSEAYLDVVARYGFDPAMTWMIGNSPRSDINPALAAGIHAVFIEHPNTWVLEHEELDQPKAPQRLLRISGFGELARHF
jgi:putative hydrolase of the HAD superfamily